MAAPCRLAPSDDVVPFHSDWDHPTVFWIMNGWNDFENNMAAGAGTCGVCYWLLPGINSGGSRNMNWTSYASEQQLPDKKTDRRYHAAANLYRQQLRFRDVLISDGRQHDGL